MKKQFISFLLLIACSVFSAFSDNSINYYYIDGWHEDNCVIKIWYTALGLLDEYDRGLNSGFEIVFDHDGKHYFNDYGANWWDYYFDFNAIGSCKQVNKKRIPRYKRSIIRVKTACTMSAERGNYLFTKYMPLQDHLKEKLNQIKYELWPKDVPVVGVYYQNPIMSEVQHSYDPVSLSDRVKQEIKDIEPCKIFIFTEQKEFAKKFIDCCDSQCETISCLENDSSTMPAEKGEHELLTMLLLAQCDVVIAPGSYQGIGAKIINPALNLIELDTIPYALK
jgi:hypothetical protein